MVLLLLLLLCAKLDIHGILAPLTASCWAAMSSNAHSSLHILAAFIISLCSRCCL
jgi:hypothetical protein